MKNVVLCWLSLVAVWGVEASPWSFSGGSNTPLGAWRAEASVSEANWQPGAAVQLQVRVEVGDAWWTSWGDKNLESMAILVTAERCFSPDGLRRLPSDERMSTLLTPSGLAIEGGAQGAMSSRAGSTYRTPLDLFGTFPVVRGDPVGEWAPLGEAMLQGKLAADLPPGLYRLRVDLGVREKKATFNLGGSTAFARRTFSTDQGTESTFFSPVFLVGPAPVEARLPWVLLADYDSNGYRGVVADEDHSWYALSSRNLIHDEVVLPLVDAKGKTLSYNLEPAFLSEEIDPVGGLAFAWPRGQLTVQVKRPDGSVQELGTHAFVGAKKNRRGPTTGQAVVTNWKPSGYGAYTVVVRGWTEDASGRRYEGGGTYRFWIAERLTLATATFQGMAWPVGSRYGRDLAFNPPLPARVTTEVRLFPSSDTARAKRTRYEGVATRGGVFGAAQGLVPFVLDEPGEYVAHILATATDESGRLWVCPYTHAGVVYAPDSALVAHGKPVVLAEKAHAARGSTLREGGPTDDGAKQLEHVTFPWNSGDVLLIASEGGGSNKIEPVLTWSRSAELGDWNKALDSIGASNAVTKTSSGYSPHVYPEQITDREYYYAAAPRPGFMGRFLVAESLTRAPYWPTSNTNFGNQVGATKGGDLPGEIYRLLGGVVRRPTTGPTEYAGYLSNAVILPGESHDNRVVAPGSEDLVGPDGTRARFFLVGFRPGMALPAGSVFAAGAQIDPVVPAHIRFSLTFPDGHTETTEGLTDKLGSFGAPQRWTLSQGGVYRYTIEGRWEGHRGRMPGLPDEGGFFFVYDPIPEGAEGLTVGLPSVSKVMSTGLTLEGKTSAPEVWCAVITPGSVLGLSTLPTTQGTFQWQFDPQALDRQSPTYVPGRVLHVSFLAQERTADGTPFWSFRRVVIRGDTVISALPESP